MKSQQRARDSHAAIPWIDTKISVETTLAIKFNIAVHKTKRNQTGTKLANNVTRVARDLLDTNLITSIGKTCMGIFVLWCHIKIDRRL